MNHGTMVLLRYAIDIGFKFKVLCSWRRRRHAVIGADIAPLTPTQHFNTPSLAATILNI